MQLKLRKIIKWYNNWKERNLVYKFRKWCDRRGLEHQKYTDDDIKWGFKLLKRSNQ